MKKIYLSILAACFLFAACNNAPEGETAEVAEEETVTTETPSGEAYNIADGSMISFYGATPTHGQNGDFPISAGAIYVEDGNVSGGNISVNLNDMVVTSEGLPDEKKADLKGHLLGEDFFNAEANGDVTFQITKAEVLENDDNNTHTISGNLKMNGNTNNISFPAKVEIAEGAVSATAEFVINRKDWGMSYKNDESLGDDWIYDEVKMSFNISAAK
jgi:polyisoprenoid-binding protein YceI